MTGQAVKRITRVAVIGGVLAAGLLVAAPAQASIGSCISEPITSSEGARAYCTGSAPSYFWAKATCYKVSTGTTKTVKGPNKTAGAGQFSVAYCPSGYELIGHSYGKVV
jgi:hypothetical protein